MGGTDLERWVAPIFGRLGFLDCLGSQGFRSCPKARGVTPPLDALGIAWMLSGFAGESCWISFKRLRIRPSATKIMRDRPPSFMRPHSRLPHHQRADPTS